MADFERIKRGIDSIKQGLDILAHGPADYYLKCLVKAYEVLLAKYAPFKVGDRVELAVTPVINKDKSPGWQGCKHFLVEGAQAVVASVECDSEDLFFEVIFDDESWISSFDKKVNPTPPERRHTYGFRAESLRHAQIPVTSQGTTPTTTTERT